MNSVLAKSSKWQSVRLSKFMVKRGGSLNPSKYPEETFDLFSIPAFDALKPDVVNGSDIGSSKQIVQPGDVLLSKIVPHIRRCWVVPECETRRQIASGEWIIFRCPDEDPCFVSRYLVSDEFYLQFMQTVAGVGGSLLRARPSQVERIQIPLPPLPEQKRIAAILDQADAIRRKRAQALRLADDFLKSAFLSLFGDPVTNPKSWPVGTIRDLMAEVKYGSSGKAGPQGEYPMLRMNNITYEGGWDFAELKYIDLAAKDVEKYTVRRGDILFNRTNSVELVGKTAVFDEDEPMAFAGYLVRGRTNKKAVPEYVAGYMNSEHGKATLRHMCKSIIGMANINAQEFQNIAITIPPIAIQRQYVDLVNQTRKSKSQMQIAHTKADHLFNALVQRAFRGEL